MFGQGLGKVGSFMIMVKRWSADGTYRKTLQREMGGQRMDNKSKILNLSNLKLWCSNCVSNWAVTW